MLLIMLLIHVYCCALCTFLSLSQSNEQTILWLQAVPFLMCKDVHNTEACCAGAHLAALPCQRTLFQALLGSFDTRVHV